jgi:hypothetical protein
MRRWATPIEYASPGTPRRHIPWRPGRILATVALIVIVLLIVWRALVLPWGERHEALEMLSQTVQLGPGDSVLDYRIHGSLGPANPATNDYRLQLTPASYRALYARLMADGLAPSPSRPWPWPTPADGIHFERGGTDYLLCPQTSVVYVSVWYD